MTTRDILRKEMNKFNEHFGIKNNPTRNLNSIQECRDNLYHQVDKLIKTRGNNANKQMYEENKSLRNKLDKLEADAEKEKKEKDKIAFERRHYIGLYKGYRDGYTEEMTKNFKLTNKLVATNNKLVKIKKKLTVSNFLLVSTTIFMILEAIIIFIFIRVAM